VATFYAARSEIITPLPWLTFALPFSLAEICELFTPDECWNFFCEAGYGSN